MADSPTCPKCGASGRVIMSYANFALRCMEKERISFECGSGDRLTGVVRGFKQSQQCRIRQLKNILREIVAQGEQYDTPDGPKIILPRKVWVEATKEVRDG